MSFAYFLLGAVAVFGAYWTLKYLYLPIPPETTTTAPTTTRPTPTTTTGGTDITTTTTAATTTYQPCKEGFKFWDEFTCFKFHAEYYDWGLANYTCQREGARLANIQSESDTNTILEYIKNCTEQGPIGEYFAVGVYRDEKERDIDELKQFDVTGKLLEDYIYRAKSATNNLTLADEVNREDQRYYGFIKKQKDDESPQIWNIYWLTINADAQFVCEMTPK